MDGRCCGWEVLWMGGVVDGRCTKEPYKRALLTQPHPARCRMDLGVVVYSGDRCLPRGWLGAQRVSGSWGGAVRLDWIG